MPSRKLGVSLAGDVRGQFLLLSSSRITAISQRNRIVASCHRSNLSLDGCGLCVLFALKSKISFATRQQSILQRQTRLAGNCRARRSPVSRPSDQQPLEKSPILVINRWKSERESRLRHARIAEGTISRDELAEYSPSHTSGCMRRCSQSLHQTASYFDTHVCTRCRRQKFFLCALHWRETAKAR